MAPAQGGGEGRVQRGGALIRGEQHAPVLVSDRDGRELPAGHDLVEVETGLVLQLVEGHLTQWHSVNPLPLEGHQTPWHTVNSLPLERHQTQWHSNNSLPFKGHRRLWHSVNLLPFEGYQTNTATLD